jgi:muramoyltetrapeptide carboxypeptidase
MDTVKIADEIRIIAPSFNWEPGYEERDELAKKRLESLGYKVTFSENFKSRYHLGTANAGDRVKDFLEAIADKNVKAIMAYSGGWSANELLPKIDWELVKANPKPLIGYSDITVLLNAVYAKTGVVGYLGPNFGALGWMTSWQYTLDNLSAVLQHKTPLELKQSHEWSDSADKEHYRTDPWKVLQEGEAEATLLGGNFNTFYLLQGTEYQPTFHERFILLIEDDDEPGMLTAKYVSRQLESIMQLPNVRKNLSGIVIGRFLPTCGVVDTDLAHIIESKHVGNIPVVAGVDLGHTIPILTLPIGGRLKLSAKKSSVDMRLLSY